MRHLLDEMTGNVSNLSKPATLDDIRDSVLLVRSSVREVGAEMAWMRLELAKLSASSEDTAARRALHRIENLLTIIAIMLAGVFGALWRIVGGWPF